MGTATTQRRRQRGEGAVYQRESDGRWVGTIDFGHVNGKRKRKGVSGKTMAEAIAKRKAAVRLAEAGDSSTKSMTVTKWLDYWMREIKQPSLKPMTYKSYANQVELYVVP